MQQINLNSVKIPEWIKYFGWIIAIVLLLWVKSCNVEPDKVKTITVTIPGKKGSFTPVKPDNAKISQIKWEKGDPVITENPLNEKLLADNENLKYVIKAANDSINKFRSANDSIKLKMFTEVNQINSFSSKFEDNNLIINVNGIARGEVKEITPSYTIKQLKTDVSIEEKLPGLRVLGGVEVGNTKTLDNLSFKGSVLLQNRKGNIISAGYDTDNKIWLGYYRSIF